MKPLALLFACLLLPLSLHAHSAAADMAATACNFLAALTPEQKSKATFAFENTERVNFHFVPIARKGLPFGEMTASQRALASAVLSSALSHRGYFKAVTIMSLEQVLFDLENQAAHRNAELYYFSVFGTPGKEVWGLRVEGHHLTLNFTARGDQLLATTPSFLGSNPAEVRTGPRAGLRVLGQEEDLARALVKSLDAAQKTKAIVATNAPNDILTGEKRKAWRLDPPGLAAAELNVPQRELLTRLLKEYLGRNRDEVAASDWQKIEQAGWDKIHFAWAGGLERGQKHYYRIQSPQWLFEYDNTQNDANHIHAVWRDFENDFGEDQLKKHYEQTLHNGK